MPTQSSDPGGRAWCQTRAVNGASGLDAIAKHSPMRPVLVPSQDSKRGGRDCCQLTAMPGAGGPGGTHGSYRDGQAWCLPKAVTGAGGLGSNPRQ